MARRSGLGRGLGALIPAESVNYGDDKLREVPIGDVRPNQLQPRMVFNEEKMASLAGSIREVGLLQPILVRQVGAKEYEIIAGERRWRAARRAGLQTITVIVHETDESGSLEKALIENLHREDLNSLEEAAAYQQLIDDFGYTHDQVARRVGKSRSAISNTLRLLQLPATVQKVLADNSISAGHARALLATPDRVMQEEIAQRIVSENLTVRMVEDIIKQLVQHQIDGDNRQDADSSLSHSLDEGEAMSHRADHDDSNNYASHTQIDDSEDSAGRDSRHSDLPEDLFSAAQRAKTLRRETDKLGNGPDEHVSKAPGILELETLLADYLNTRVHVDLGGKKGKLIIEFYTIEDLERIYKVMVD
ncbi:MAG: ParB/RepB/Spo0J family partition protein [Actinobacteria bacterium]|jgi:ParB family chromosome partitioning protein|nr:ParB/RepB/Spo0J family partition protein [Actinomycetota bacterium]